MRVWNHPACVVTHWNDVKKDKAPQGRHTQAAAVTTTTNFTAATSLTSSSHNKIFSNSYPVDNGKLTLKEINSELSKVLRHIAAKV